MTERGARMLEALILWLPPLGYAAVTVVVILGTYRIVELVVW